MSPTPNSTPSPSENALFLEAKDVHQKYLDQVLKLEKAGGADDLPADLQVLVTGQYKRDVEDSYRKLKSLGTRADEDSVFRVLWVRESPVWGTGVVAIRACVDASDVVFQDKNGNTAGHGGTRQDDLEFTRSGSRLVIFDGDSKRVERCSK
ncbi:MAG: hypothetical protein LKI24_00790 [Acidipropionibacterium sp.]|nr:hypothetical protein [Acidipropionibacterium sp.]